MQWKWFHFCACSGVICNRMNVLKCKVEQNVFCLHLCLQSNQAKLSLTSQLLSVAQQTPSSSDYLVSLDLNIILS